MKYKSTHSEREIWNVLPQQLIFFFLGLNRDFFPWGGWRKREEGGGAGEGEGKKDSEDVSVKSGGRERRKKQ